jgi:Cys-tRNA(Pro) deacylase
METPTLGPADLKAYMQAHGIPGEILHLSVPTPTVEAAAQAVGTNPDHIVKSILFLVDNKPVLAIACGQAYVERRALAAAFGVGRKKVKLASPESVLEATGYHVGAMPPFGHHVSLPTLIDWRVLEFTEIYAGGGDDNTLVRLPPQSILLATQARVIDLIAPPGQSSNNNPD